MGEEGNPAHCSVGPCSLWAACKSNHWLDSLSGANGPLKMGHSRWTVKINTCAILISLNFESTASRIRLRNNTHSWNFESIEHATLYWLWYYIKVWYQIHSKNLKLLESKKIYIYLTASVQSSLSWSVVRLITSKINLMIGSSAQLKLEWKKWGGGGGVTYSISPRLRFKSRLPWWHCLESLKNPPLTQKLEH